ncbi:hypothetical protein QEZ52_03295 [Aliisedimentitalea scapharcae]|uniref:Uncharacterized protein n=1 Tax=Aliisedimentitalea scapharcae TaxID=1524259 RepID=A0ABZ2XW69_9RHOB
MRATAAGPLTSLTPMPRGWVKDMGAVGVLADGHFGVCVRFWPVPVPVPVPILY